MDRTKMKQQLRDEAQTLGGRLSEWLDTARAEAGQRLPDVDQLQSQARTVWGNVGDWAAELPAAAAKRMPGYESPAKRRTKTALGLLVAAGIGAALMYLFDRERGAERRARLSSKFQKMAPEMGGPNGHRRSKASHSSPGITG